MTTKSTLDLVRSALAKANTANTLAKANTFTQPSSATTGLQGYDLEAPAKNLYPVLTPLRNVIPRVKPQGVMGTQANWKAVTAINVGQIYSGVAEGRRGQMLNHATADYNASYRTIGQESAVTFEAELASEGFDDIRARAASTNLETLMIEEERIILGGNTSVQIGTTNAPSLAVVASGGAIGASAQVSVVCIAMSYDAYRRFASLTVDANTAPTPILTVSPTDGAGTYQVGAGFAAKSANTTVTTGSGSTANVVVAKVVPTRGAFGYAWFWGTAGSERLGAFTSTSALTIATANGASNTTPSAFTSDNSTSSLIHDGLLTIVSNPAFNGNWVAAAPGQGLTGDGNAGITEFDNLLQNMWDKWRLQPDEIHVSSQETRLLKNKILAAGGAQNSVRFAFNVGPGQTVTGGGVARAYLTPFSMTGGTSEIPISMHPDMPPGTVLFTSKKLPYKVNNIDNIMQVKCRRDYYQLEWPLRMRTYESGVYSDQVLQHYAPFSMGVITNLANV